MYFFELNPVSIETSFPSDRTLFYKISQSKPTTNYTILTVSLNGTELYQLQSSKEEFAEGITFNFCPDEDYQKFLNGEHTYSFTLKEYSEA